MVGEPRLLKFQAGRRKRSWVRNCLALGLSSGFLEPLESTSIYLVQIAIMHLLPLFPTKAKDPRLAEEFNRRMEIEYDRIRDFLILHYHLNSRDDAEIWRYCRSMEVPDSLRQRMELFRHSGIIKSDKDGLFTPPSWLSVLVGQGLTPEHYHPLADAQPLERALSELDELRMEIQDRVDEMPKHASLVAKFADALDHAEGRGRILSRRVDTVAVVGRDAPAWLAAAALKRSFGRTGLRVQVVELPRLRAPADVYAAVPSLSSLHQLLGLEERIVLGAAGVFRWLLSASPTGRGGRSVLPSL